MFINNVRRYIDIPISVSLMDEWKVESFMVCINYTLRMDNDFLISSSELLNSVISYYSGKITLTTPFTQMI
jgi:hypothetical protein